jgi:hypothetical protein
MFRIVVDANPRVRKRVAASRKMRSLDEVPLWVLSF